MNPSKRLWATAEGRGVASLQRVQDGYGVRLKELTPTCHLGGPCGCGGCGWDAGRFRKVYRPKAALMESMTVRAAPRERRGVSLQAQ